MPKNRPIMLPIGLLFISSGTVYASLRAFKKFTGKERTLSFSNTEEEVTHSNIKPEKSLPAELRHQQMVDISYSTTVNNEISEFDQEANYYLPVSITGLGLATVGVLGFPLLSVLSVPVSLYASFPIFQEAYQSLIKERKLKVAVLDSIAIMGGLVTGFYFVTAFWHPSFAS